MRIIRSLLLAEPFFLSPFFFFVYYGILVDNPLYAWSGIGIAFIFLVLNFVGGGAKLLPFDIPVLLFLLGALLGLPKSFDIGVGIKFLASLIACALIYRLIAQYGRIYHLVRWGFILFLLLSLFYIALGIKQGVPPHMRFLSFPFLPLPEPPRWLVSPKFPILRSNGVSLMLSIGACVLFGVMIFGRGRLKVGAGILFILILALVLFKSFPSILRLFTGVSIGRRVSLWGSAWSLLEDDLLLGLGPGSWAFLFNEGGIETWRITHPHNAYLEIWSDTGISGLLGIISSFVPLFILIRRIARSERCSLKGWGMGFIFATLFTLLVGFLETASFGTPVIGEGSYSFVVLPSLFIFWGVLTGISRELSG